MKFKFKRKYTFFFLIALLLHIGLVSFWMFCPSTLFSSLEEKKVIFLLTLVNIEIILFLYLGLFKKQYYSYYDKIIIKRSMIKDVEISYKDITRIKEKNNDSILFGFGKRPSFTIYYGSKQRKKYTIRSDNNELLLKIIKNEITISTKSNSQTK